ncbi:unnamed protein product [Cuscuta europaea]|uniref:Uncharacterized protein n=1 Tax=Cuscuta europaea TaxID=41803 RepID=A0A9P1EHG7_CUSEU|nr:unnamed protein product [Cuscuta europaea]
MPFDGVIGLGPEPNQFRPQTWTSRPKPSNPALETAQTIKPIKEREPKMTCLPARPAACLPARSLPPVRWGACLPVQQQPAFQPSGEPAVQSSRRSSSVQPASHADLPARNNNCQKQLMCDLIMYLIPY